MSAKLTFDMSELQPIIEHTRSAKEFTAPYGIGKPEPSLYFVKDSGIYLMSAAKKGQMDPKYNGPSEKRLVAYAKGYEPEAEDSWEKCREAVGDDDFAEALPLAWFMGALDAGATKLHLHVSEKAIRASTTIPKKRSAS